MLLKRPRTWFATQTACSEIELVSFVADTEAPMQSDEGGSLEIARETNQIADFWVVIANHSVFKRLQKIFLKFEMG